jgi:hypothetical protein
VTHRNGFDLDSRDGHSLSPGQLIDLPKAPDEVTIARLHDDGHIASQRAQRTQVSVVHVCVRQEQQVDLW